MHQLQIKHRRLGGMNYTLPGHVQKTVRTSILVWLMLTCKLYYNCTVWTYGRSFSQYEGSWRALPPWRCDRSSCTPGQSRTASPSQLVACSMLCWCHYIQWWGGLECVGHAGLMQVCSKSMLMHSHYTHSTQQYGINAKYAIASTYFSMFTWYGAIYILHCWNFIVGNKLVISKHKING